MLLLSLVMGCYTHEEFLQEDAQVTCEWFERCDMMGSLGYEGLDDCVQEWGAWNEADPPVCEGFDAGAAQDCVDSKAVYTCSDEAEQYATACDEVCGES